jgi:hypothetical protein
MITTDRPDLDDPRALALAKARQQISHEGMFNPTWDELTAHEQEMSRLDALNYLHAAIRAGLIPADNPPTDRHDRVYVDDEGFLYTDYRTVPPGDELVRLFWDEGTAISRRELETEHGVTFRHIGWCT